MERGYIKTYNWVMKLLQDCDFEESSKRMGLRLISQNKIVVNFLDRTYFITKDAIELAGQKIKWTVRINDYAGYEYDLKSVLGYYLLSESDADPANDFCPLEHFSRGVFRNNDNFLGPLERVYGKNYEEFKNAAEKIGMTLEMEKSSGKHSWKYMLLPRMPVKIIYYEGDDEYPTKLQVLYDKSAIKILKFEPLAVLHGCFVKGLAAIGESEFDRRNPAD
ncbi:MAG: DUF3786 domain-containing protein [Spirochaetaceae bacterium]|nr:DUF3786 domain-containing protein [Spirochaetaceae bacterium]